MKTFQYNENVTLGYEHIPLHGSGNAFTGQLYRTKVYLIQGNARYDMGWEDAKLEEEEIRSRFKELMTVEQQQRYGQHGTLLRRELPNRRDRNRTSTTLRRPTY